MADDSLEITSVRIQNFRSIVDQTFRPTRLSLFTGLNDVGKSNVLRALDLFFNSSQSFSLGQFEREFCLLAATPVRKAKEIRITLTLKLPSSYSAQGEIQWRKVWRKSGLHLDGGTMSNADGSPLKRLSRIPALLESIRFEYVPAIKGNDYFAQLLGSLHDILVETVEQDIRSASGSFTATINKSTSAALDEIKAKLKLSSSLELPADLRELFSRLDFQSKRGATTLSLAQRGDGIKVRHIPILLNFLAQQTRWQKTPGMPQINTIWGFEEPENNLEMSRAVELAKEFIEYSRTIQIFATTHSPAFYSLAQSHDQCSVFLVTTASESECETKITPISTESLPAVDEHVGLLPLVAPSFAKAVRERDNALVQLEFARKADRPTIFLEGKTDITTFEKAIGLWAPHVLSRVNLRSDTSAGANWIKDMLIAWAHSRNPHKALGIFDSDDAGRLAKSEVNSNQRVTSANHASQKEEKGMHIQGVEIGKPAHIVPIFKKTLKLPVAMEELFPLTIWRHAEAQGWLVQRTDIVKINEFSALGKTFEQHCSDKGITDDELFLLVHSVPNENKEKFAKYVCKLSGAKLEEAFSAFKPLVKQIEIFFTLQPAAATTTATETATKS